MFNPFCNLKNFLSDQIKYSWGEQERYNAPFPPAWYEAYDILYDYYRRSPTDLATSYARDITSLTAEETDRLKHEGSGHERDILLLHLPPSDPVVVAITTRLTVSLDSGYSILL